ncbi:hypothetical protein [Agreia bicolorata]|uniref:Fibronectin type-III domain-containing protein n=1 Tax=Agreia bicolorata TaxID=110935 RepID=A0ABR5CD74_9MICO|nr:hypothetical protein [Agreia bicolorata]KJC63580.1 hypothetical protein TZ00_13655 [Agreia bicolorata]
MRPASPGVSSISRSRSRVGTVAIGTFTLALVVVGLVASPSPSTVVQAGVGDSGVWVTSVAASAVGRVNTEVAELNVAVPMLNPRAEVVQSGSRVIIVDRDAGTATLLNPATARPGGSVALPAPSVGLVITGSDALITSQTDGRVWSVPLDAFGRSAVAPDPVFDLGPGAVVATTPVGGVIAVSPTTHELLRAEPGTSIAQADRAAVELPADSGPLQIVATTTAWAVLEASASMLATPAGQVDLSDFTDGDVADVVLQAAVDVEPELSSASPVNSVLVSTRSSLLEIELGTGTVSVLDSGHDGAPVRPVVTGGCTFAAWGDGTSWQRCAGDPTAGVAGVLSGLEASDRPVFHTNSGRAVLNDSVSGRVWVPQSGNREIDSWAKLLARSNDAAGTSSSTVTVPIAVGPVGQLERIGVDHDSPSSGGSPSPPTEVVATLPPAAVATLPEPPSVPDAGPAHESPARPPVSAPVTAILQPETGTVSLSWAPFDGRGDPVRGYFTQSLGPGATTVESPCVLLPSGGVQAPRGGTVVDVGAWTSGSFDGIDRPGASYGFIVWGYNGAGCAASDVVTVTPRAAPAAVTALDGEMIDVGTDYDYEITSIAPEASRYEVQRLDAAGSPAGDVAEISLAGSVAVPRALTGGPFGEVYSFRIRACNAQDEGAACGPWSDRAAPEESLTFEPADLNYSAETGTWSWSSLPLNGSLPVRAKCGSWSHQEIPAFNSAAKCWTDPAIPQDDAWLLVFVGSKSRMLP